MENSLDDLVEAASNRLAPFEPTAYYDPDGDHIELHVLPETFDGERLDEWITIFRGIDSGKVVGAQVKGVCHRLLEHHPGLRIYIEDSSASLGIILKSAAFTADSEEVQRNYKAMLSDLELAANLDSMRVALPSSDC